MRSAPTVASTSQPRDLGKIAGLGTLPIWLGLLVTGAALGYWKPVEISVIACLAMLAGAVAGKCLSSQYRGQVWADGLAAGTMLTSASLFLLPMAMHADPVISGLGIAAGLMCGAMLQGMARLSGRETTTLDPSIATLSLHALGAGLVIGLLYGRMPAINLLLGVAIVSHKLPAGYAAVRNLQQRKCSLVAVMLPACAVGMTCLPTSMVVTPSVTGHGSAVFGFATGAFLYVAVEFTSPTSGHGAGHDSWRCGFAAILGAMLVVTLRQLST